MKDLNKSHNIAGQSNDNVQKSHKHDANLQKNSTLYFQIGLILCLLGTFGIFEMQFETKSNEYAITFLEPDPDHTFDLKNYIPEPDAPKKDPVKQKQQRIIDKEPNIIDNDVPTQETPDLVSELPPSSDPIDPSDFIEPVEPKPTPPEIFNMKDVEIVPIYPGCEKKTTNKERVKCMSEKLTRLVQKKFNTDIAQDYGLEGVQRISVQFKIDENGDVTEVLTRAPHPSLEKEAERLANRIPKMKPGEQRHKPVSVIYNLPIVFKVN
ncbi:energy transducer TonB [Psychroserpens sp. SPM9]|uniref:energy transducer TonB n=1 Tax=Psychroserpens sp. SPM9 TaxID=2975598 RepID=UPI0021A33E92|nr:energy transducer TonB [Psychroserpens sp. SPM9]MDG5490706.1 energy transducer TonB [Psychroserpens sp. SPM9]